MLLDEFLAREAPGLRAARDSSGAHSSTAIAIRRRSPGWAARSRCCRASAGAELEVLDAGCCGMAGAFGYEREHFEVSRTIGERVLIPAIEQAPPDAMIIADGFSCRSQIRQFCPSRRPLHLAEVLNLQLG